MGTQEQFVILNDDTLFFDDTRLPFKSAKDAEEHVRELLKFDNFRFSEDIKILKVVRKLVFKFTDA